MPNESFTNHQESSPIIIQPEAVTKDGFIEFGDIILSEKSIGLSESSSLTFIGDPCVRLLVTDFRDMIITRMTRHNKCSECFCSTDFRSWYMAVCPADRYSQKPIVSKIKVFLIPPNAIVCLKPGAWHNGPFPVTKNSNSSFTLIQCTNTEIEDRDTQCFAGDYVCEINTGFIN
jgi:ureidoglycolate hydrolase